MNDRPHGQNVVHLRATFGVTYVFPGEACADTAEATGGTEGDHADQEGRTVDDLFEQGVVRMGGVVATDALAVHACFMAGPAVWSANTPSIFSRFSSLAVDLTQVLKAVPTFCPFRLMSTHTTGSTKPPYPQGFVPFPRRHRYSSIHSTGIVFAAHGIPRNF